MPRYLTLLALLIAGCAATSPLIPVPDATAPVRVFLASPVASATIAPSPSPIPSLVAVLPYPIVLTLDPALVRAGGAGFLVDEVTRAADTWNTALGKIVFGTSRRVVTVKLQNKTLDGPHLEQLGDVDSYSYATVVSFDVLTMEIDNDLTRKVALHELGHIIGLSHSNDPNDIMYWTTIYSSGITSNDVMRSHQLLNGYTLRVDKDP